MKDLKGYSREKNVKFVSQRCVSNVPPFLQYRNWLKICSRMKTILGFCLHLHSNHVSVPNISIIFVQRHLPKATLEYKFPKISGCHSSRKRIFNSSWYLHRSDVICGNTSYRSRTFVFSSIKCEGTFSRLDPYLVE